MTCYYRFDSFRPLRFKKGPLAQLVEHLTFNQVVEGSIPSRLTFLFGINRKSPHRLAWPRTPAFHAGDAGSNPAGDANFHPKIGFIISQTSKRSKEKMALKLC
ncbi:uncharacterized protein METZ01_LOCUS174520 [marine metagenome]|uniref:Uncharacterized protein n=1 Tax=marine metagenome TaxID=408172 RepID=A0A382C6G7_9ZZZZ